MAIVRKKNRVLKVSDAAVGSYLAEGYDEIDNKGKVVKEATGGKKISVGAYNKLKAEVEKLKKENEALKKAASKKETKK